MKTSYFIARAVLVIFAAHLAAGVQADPISNAIPEKGEIKFYKYFDTKTLKDFKGYAVASGGSGDEIELTECVAKAKVKLKKINLQPDDGPCAGVPHGPFSIFTYFVPGRVKGVTADQVTVAIQTAEGAKDTTLPKDLFGVVAPGEEVMFVPQQELWGQSKQAVSAAFTDWQSDNPVSGGRSFNVLMKEVGG